MVNFKYRSLISEIRKFALYVLIIFCFIAVFTIVVKAETTLVKDNRIEVSQSEVMCLAENMYWEARNQSKAAMLAVSHVVINRVADKRFPNSICEVVYQGPTRKSWKDPNLRLPVRNRCQFSWYCDGKSDIPPKIDSQLWHETKLLASHFLFNYGWLLDPTDGATHYHAYYVKPGWAKQKKRTARIESHIFYRWKK
tara:strand:- start:1651 stop:2238 length:588 start_codon:yes stop_codon:yes gene_type:complete